MDQPNPRPPLARLFLTTPEVRLRAGWRLAGQMALFIFGLTLLAFPTFISVIFFQSSEWFKFLTGDLAVETILLVSGPPQFLAGLLSVFLARRLLDRRTIRSLGLVWNRQAWQDLLLGMAIPGVIFAFIYLIELVFKWTRFEGYAWQSLNLPLLTSRLLFLLAVFIAVGLYEEVIFRGYWLQNITESLNLRWGVLLSSIAFAIIHLGNPGAGPSAIIGLVLGGFFFAFSYLRSNALWMPIGLHIGWNFFEGPVFGFPVSGVAAFRLIEQSQQGPEIWTGGAFGPEAGIILIPALILGFILVGIYTRNRHALENGE
jgi:membrane protease YdiL (CAAX protease family)